MMLIPKRKTMSSRLENHGRWKFPVRPRRAESKINQRIFVRSCAISHVDARDALTISPSSFFAIRYYCYYTA